MGSSPISDTIKNKKEDIFVIYEYATQFEKRQIDMKKFLFSVLGIFCLVIAGNFVFAQNNHYPSAFIDAFQACKPYTLTIEPINMMGMQVTTKKQIVGIKNGLCSYVEVVGPVDAKNTIKCNFNQTQINKLVSDMKNNTTSAWYEYYNNPSVCKTYTP